MDLSREAYGPNNSDYTNPWEDCMPVEITCDIYKQVFKHSIFPKIIHDMDMRIIEANDSAIREFGFSRNNLLKKKIFDLLPKVEQRSSVEDLKNKKRKKRLTVEKKFRRKDGSIFIADVTPYMYLVVDKIVIHVHIQNITERKQTEEKMQALNVAMEIGITREEANAKQIEIMNMELEGLAYVVAHDLKAPVTNLNVLIDMISADSIVGEKDNQLFAKLKNNVEQVYKKVFALNDVINFKTTLKDEKELLDFEIVFAEVKQVICKQVETNIIFDVDFSKCSEIEYPPLHLKCILQNILANSVKYKSPDRSLKIEVRTMEFNGIVGLTIKDNGLGFDAEKYGQKVFGLFKRLHTHVEGQGVGMYMVKSIVEAHGGKIEVESKINEGTTFVLNLNNGNME